jgi:hypothetical protein
MGLKSWVSKEIMSMNENANIEYKQNTSLMPCQGQILP